MKKCIVPGSFDPITKGHVDIINRSLACFDEVIIAVLNNSEKTATFPIERRIEIIGRLFDGNNRVKIVSFNGLLVDLCKKEGTNVIVRGLRNASDYDYESNLFYVNKKLYPEFETMFFQTTQDNLHVSSRYVRELLSYDGDITDFVEEDVKEEITSQYLKYHK